MTDVDFWTYEEYALTHALSLTNARMGHLKAAMLLANQAEFLGSRHLFHARVSTAADSPAKPPQNGRHPGNRSLAYEGAHRLQLPLGNVCASLQFGTFHTRGKNAG